MKKWNVPCVQGVEYATVGSGGFSPVYTRFNTIEEGMAWFSESTSRSVQVSYHCPDCESPNEGKLCDECSAEATEYIEANKQEKPNTVPTEKDFDFGA